MANPPARPPPKAPARAPAARPQAPRGTPPGVYRTSWPPQQGTAAPSGQPGQRQVAHRKVGFYFLIGLVAMVALLMIVYVLGGANDIFGKVYGSAWDLFFVVGVSIYATRLMASPAYAPIAYATYAVSALQAAAFLALIWGDWDVGLFRDGEDQAIFNFLVKSSVTGAMLLVLSLVSTFLIRRWQGNPAARGTGLVAIASLAAVCTVILVMMWGEIEWTDGVGRLLSVLIIIAFATALITALMSMMNRKPGPLAIQ